MRDSTVSIGARHAGLVLGLVLIAPVLTASLDHGIDRATLGATRSMLEAQVPVADKVAVTWDLRDAIDATPKGQVPDLAPGVRRARRQAATTSWRRPATGS